MEAKRLQQRQDAAKSEDTEVTIARGSGGGKGSEVKGIAFSLTHIERDYHTHDKMCQKCKETVCDMRREVSSI